MSERLRNTAYRWCLLIMVVVLALPAMAEWKLVDPRVQQAVAPQAVFHSTSCMRGSGSTYASQPRISAEGTAVYTTTTTYSPSVTTGPRKGTVNPEEGDDFLPVGDGLWILMLMAISFAGTQLYRRKKARPSPN